MYKNIPLGVALAVLFGFAAFLSLSPYFIWHTHVLKVAALAIFGLTFFYLFNQGSMQKKNYYLFLFFSVVFIFLQFSGEGIVFYLTSSIVLLFPFFLLSDNLKLKAFNVFCYLFAISLVPGLIIVFLLFLGVDFPWFQTEPTNKLKVANGLYYRNYLLAVILSNQIYSLGFGEVFRFSGMFDEPGKIGTVSALLLSADGFKLKTWQSKVILLGGMLSFSLAFYVLVLVYALIKRPIYLVIVLAPFLMLGSVYFDNVESNPVVKKYVLDRFEKAYNDIDSVDNRVSDCFQVEFDEFNDNGHIFLGNGAGAHTMTGCDVSSYATIIYNHGYLGFLSIVMLYLFVLYATKPKAKHLLNLAPFFLIFAMNMYQRPEVLSLWMVLIFVGAILHCKFLSMGSSRSVMTQ